MRRTQCTYDSQRDNTCAPLGEVLFYFCYPATCSTTTGYAYNVSISDSNNANEVTIKVPWTRGLALHPLGTFQHLDDVIV